MNSLRYFGKCFVPGFLLSLFASHMLFSGTERAGGTSNVQFIEESGGISHYQLKSNGMNLFLSQNRTAPVITFMVVYHVGSRNEAPGNTGSAHLLEHMIFNKSTENFGKANGHRTFQEVLYQAGANYGSTNMTTSYDRMNGYSTLPADKLELAMRIEADRLGRGLILDEERKSEMSVVRNEFEIGENNPGGVLFKMVVATAIQAHPYHWSTIGYRSDIEGVSTEKLREHYRNFFRPDNADAILVGDFDLAKALEMFDAQFGGFERPTKPIPQVITVEPPQQGERRVMVERPGQVKIVEMVYPRPGSLHPDFIPLTVLSDIVGSGVNSRLYRSVVESGLATDASAWNGAFKDPYVFEVDATVAPGFTHQQVEDSMKTALYRVGKEGVTKDELENAKKRIIFDVIRSRDGTYQYASGLGEAIASANWKWFLGYIDAVKAVTRADVQRVAARYLIPEHATVGWFVPQASGATASASVSTPEVVDSAVDSHTPVPSRTSAPVNERAVTRTSFSRRTVHRVLPNGLTLDIVENHTVPVVSIEGAFLGGESLTRATQPALGGLTAHMMERGTKSRSKEEIAKVLDGAGASISFGADSYASTVSASLPASALGLVLDVMSDEVLHPAFKADELQKAKASMKNDVLNGSESTGTRGFERLTQIVFPADYPYRAPASEQMMKSIDTISTDDVASFHSRYYNGKSFILAIVGDVDAEATVKLVEKAFRNLEPGVRPTLQYRRIRSAGPVREVVTMPGKANMNLYYGLASGLRRSDPDYEAALVANAALGQSGVASRLGRRVRDTEGLSYNLYSRFTLSDALDGVWFVSVAVAPMNLQKAMKSSMEEIQKFCTGGITAGELEIQKDYFAGNYQVSLGTNAGVAGALVTAERYGFGPSYLDDYPQRMRKVTLDEANEAIKKHIHFENINTVVAGDIEKLPD